MGKLIMPDRWMGDRPIYFKPAKGKRIELLRMDGELPVEVHQTIFASVQSKIETFKFLFDKITV